MRGFVCRCKGFWREPPNAPGPVAESVPFLNQSATGSPDSLRHGGERLWVVMLAYNLAVIDDIGFITGRIWARTRVIRYDSLSAEPEERGAA